MKAETPEDAYRRAANIVEVRLERSIELSRSLPNQGDHRRYLKEEVRSVVKDLREIADGEGSDSTAGDDSGSGSCSGG